MMNRVVKSVYGDQGDLRGPELTIIVLSIVLVASVVAFVILIAMSSIT